MELIDPRLIELSFSAFQDLISKTSWATFGFGWGSKLFQGLLKQLANFRFQKKTEFKPESAILVGQPG